MYNVSTEVSISKRLLILNRFCILYFFLIRYRPGKLGIHINEDWNIK